MINNVQIVDLKKFDDERGSFGEIFRAKWFSKYDNSRIQLNHSFSKKGTLRGLHYHYWQYDFWYVITGLLYVCLLDLRKDSTTVGEHQFIVTDNKKGIFIPPGVAHGFYAIEDSNLIYVVNNYYDGNDEYTVNWQTVDWGNIEELLISDRDQNAPYLNEIDESTLVF